MISDLSFNDQLSNQYANAFEIMKRSAEENTFDRYLPLLVPYAERLYTYFSLCFENGSRTVAEWESLGYDRKTLTLFAMLSREIGWGAFFAEDGTFTQKF